jgi:glycosyltransferase involved in cell wall biosynthesis
VVATRCGGPEEILTPETGELADIDDPRGLATAIETALGRSYDRVRMRSEAVARFGTAAAAERLGRLYGQVTGLRAELVHG